VLQFVVWSK